MKAPYPQIIKEGHSQHNGGSDGNPYYLLDRKIIAVRVLLLGVSVACRENHKRAECHEHEHDKQKRIIDPVHLTGIAFYLIFLFPEPAVSSQALKKWSLTSFCCRHFFLLFIYKNIIRQDGNQAIVGYKKGRIEVSGATSAKWQPNERLGMSIVLREELYGQDWTPIIPAFFMDGVLSKKGNIVAKASISRNFRFPTLNDLYFLPGGNPDLKRESGWTYDVGVSFAVGKENIYSLSGSVNWFDSYVKDWILWLPTTKGFFSPRNVKDVHAYGIEAQSDFNFIMGKDWQLALNGTLSWTPSINEGEPMSPADQSVGKQLPYVPEWSSSLTGRITWKSWSLLYKWCYYSKRHTMSSNDISLTGKLPSYFMNNLTIEKGITTNWADLSLKGAINNLFNEEYLSVLSRPMPGINFELFISITPHFK